MSLRILLTGKNGQIGHELSSFLSQLGDLLALDRSGLDLVDVDAIRRRVREVRPNLIVNAAAYTAVDRAESEKALAIAVNTRGPAVLAEEARSLGAALVHYSTDYVFDGTKNAPYSEIDPTNPINVYGKSKLEGERAIREIGPAHLIFRTSWVYDTRGHNFLRTILRLATESEELRVVSDQKGAPTWSRAIAVATVQTLAKVLGKEDRISNLFNYSSLYHLTAAGETTWYEFARSILKEASDSRFHADWFDAATSGRPLITRRVMPISAADYPSPVRRPANSVLSNTRLWEELQLRMVDWRKQLHLAMYDAQFVDAQSSTSM